MQVCLHDVVCLSKQNFEKRRDTCQESSAENQIFSLTNAASVLSVFQTLRVNFRVEMADKAAENSGLKAANKANRSSELKQTNQMNSSPKLTNRKDESSNVLDKADKNSDLKIARQLKKFIESYIESEFKEKNVQEMPLQDLVYAVNKTEYGEFLRSFFKIDSRQLAKRLHMFLLTYPDRFVVDAEKGIVRFVSPKELGDLKYTVEERTCDFLLFWYILLSRSPIEHRTSLKKFTLFKAISLSKHPSSSPPHTSLSLQPNFLIPVKQLRAYLRYSAVDVERYAKNYEKLEDYLAIYPALFFVTDEYVGLASAKRNMQKRGFNLSRHEQISLEERLITKVEYIDTVEAGKAVSDYILSSDIELIAFDSEGR